MTFFVEKKTFITCLFFCAVIACSVFAVVSIDWAVMKSVQPFYFACALFFSVLGFYFQSLSWFFSVQMLAPSRRYSRKRALFDHGVTIMAKYIPGKILSVVGRAGLASAYTGLGLKDTATVSFQNVVMSVFVGLAVSFLILFVLGEVGAIPFAEVFEFSFFFLVVVTCTLLLCFVWVYAVKRVGLLNKYFLFVIISYSLNWIAWVLGIVLLFYSITGNFDVVVSAAFCLATCVGVLALFSPGGLGVREAILASFLVHQGYSLDLSVLVSVAARVWFLGGELVLFMHAFMFLGPRLKTKK